MRKKLLAAFVAGGLIEISRCDRGGGSSRRFSVRQSSESRDERRTKNRGEILLYCPDTGHAKKEGSSAFREKRIILPAAGMR